MYVRNISLFPSASALSWLLTINPREAMTYTEYIPSYVLADNG